MQTQDTGRGEDFQDLPGLTRLDRGRINKRDGCSRCDKGPGLGCRWLGGSPSPPPHVLNNSSIFGPCLYKAQPPHTIGPREEIFGRQAASLLYRTHCCTVICNLYINKLDSDQPRPLLAVNLAASLVHPYWKPVKVSPLKRPLFHQPQRPPVVPNHR